MKLASTSESAMDLKSSKATTFQLEPSFSTSTPGASTIPNDDSSGFIWVPLAVLLGILLFSAVVYLMARNRRRLVHIYCKRKHAPSFTFNEDSDDSAMEQGGDFDDPTECLLKGKLQIDNRYENYQTTQVSQITAAGQSKTYA